MVHQLARRSFLTGLAAAIAAPAIVRVDSIMPVRSPKLVMPSTITIGPGMWVITSIGGMKITVQPPPRGLTISVAGQSPVYFGDYTIAPGQSATLEYREFA